MLSLFSPHALVLQTAYSELKRLALEQRLLLVGTPGSVSVRTVNGRPFLYRQFYDANGAKRSDYLGPEGDRDAEARAKEIREAIAVTNGLLRQARLLARQGYVRADTAPSAVGVALASNGLFEAGAVLVGSHAYGVLLNELGVRAAAVRTKDVGPRVDLLVPTRGSKGSSKLTSELGAHATALPHLGYLLDDPMEAVLIGREAVVPVRVPRPERFALHKALLSQLRHASSDKTTKDIHQAATLLAALAENEPGAIEEAFAEAPAKTKTRAGMKRVLALLETTAHARAIELVRAL